MRQLTQSSAQRQGFCAELLALGRASAGEGDLPLIGEEGGDPKRES